MLFLDEINRLFFKNKNIAKIIFKIFSIFFSKINRIPTEFFFKYEKISKIIFKILFEFFFSENFFYEHFFLEIFFWWKFFFSQKYFCEDFFHNIFTNFFCIWCLRNNVYCENFYSKLCLLRIFLFCNFGVWKKKLKKVKFSLIVLLDFFIYY